MLCGGILLLLNTKKKYSAAQQIAHPHIPVLCSGRYHDLYTTKSGKPQPGRPMRFRKFRHILQRTPEQRRGGMVEFKARTARKPNMDVRCFEEVNSRAAQWRRS